MQLIEHYEVPSGGVSSIVLDDIPQTFTDLYLVLSLRSNRSSFVDGYYVKLNSTTPTVRFLQGVGSGSGQSGTSFNAVSSGNTSTANTFSNDSVYIPNYASTTQNKSYSIDSVMENNATDSYQQISANLYASNSAVTQITIESFTANSWREFSSATLYGITAGSDSITTVS